MSTLRNYQIEAIELIKKEFSSGHRKVLLKLATGAGKTVIFCEILKRISANNKKCLLVTRGREIVDQASRRLAVEGVSHGVRMAGHWNTDYQAAVQVASIDTLLARDDYPEADLIVIDEADQATSDGYRRFIEKYPNAKILSVTATPYTSKDLTHIAESLISPISIKELTIQGYLSPLRCFGPSNPDLTEVKITRGEYNENQLAEKMSTLTGDIISHYKTIGENRPTILFAVNVNHSKCLADSFNNAGISAEHCDALTEDEDRKKAFKRLETGETKILCTVGIATRGVDLPFVSCLIMARPTKSYALYIQMSGRGTRIFEDKKDCIVLDHAGNVLRHGFVTDEPEIDLTGTPVKKKSPEPRVCASCYAIFVGSKCQACGTISAPKERKEIETESGVLKEFEGFPEAAAISLYVRRIKELAKKRGYKKGYVYYLVKEKFGEEIAVKASPPRQVPHWIRKRPKGQIL